MKEEPKAGDIRGGEYPVAFAHALNNSANNNSANNNSANNNSANNKHPRK